MTFLKVLELTSWKQLCVHHCVGNNYFTLVQFHNCIKNFPYSGADKTNKPTPMSTSMQMFEIRQTASQMWCLMRLFPLLVGQFVPESDPLWKLFCVLMNIIDIICAQVISEHDISLVELYVADFLWKLSAPESLHVKPKAHFMIHYASQMRRFGPLIHCWTIRFEGKHNYFKEVIATNKNRRNLTKTMATRHQYLQAVYSSERNVFSSPIDSTRGKKVLTCTLDLNTQHLLKDVTDSTEVYQVQSATCGGTKYSLGLCVITGNEDDDYVFGKIEHIFIIGGDVHLVVMFLRVLEFSEHYHAYSVLETDRRTMLLPSNLLDYNPLSVYFCQSNQQLLIPLKYKVKTGL